MTDREKLRQVMAVLLSTAADIQKYLGTVPAEPDEPTDPTPTNPTPTDPKPTEPTDPKPTDPSLNLQNFPAGGVFTSYTAATEKTRDPSGYRVTPQVASVVNGNLRLTARADMMWPRANWPLTTVPGKVYTVTVGHVTGNEYGYWVKVLDSDSDAAATRYERADLYENHTFDFTATKTTHWLQIMSGVGSLNRYRDFSGVSIREKPATVPVEPTTPTTPTDPNAPVVDTSRPIWQQMRLPTATAPSEVFVPSGQNRVLFPVTLEHTDMNTVIMRASRAANMSPATINVGTNQGLFLRNPDGVNEIFRWSPGDDLTHWVELQFPQATYRDGQQVRITMTLAGVREDGGNDHRQKNIVVTFRDGATLPNKTPQRHRAPYRLDISQAQQKGEWNRDPASWEWSESGFKGDKRVLRSRLSHGYAQQGNGETGLYMNAERFPRAVEPHSYDPIEKAVRLRTAAAPDDQPFVHDRVVYPHQAAVLQGQTVDDLCGNEGVWRLVAKNPTKRFTWPAWWLIGRGSSGRSGSWTAWPPEIDIMEQFNQVYNQDPITGFTTHWGQHYGNHGSNTRLGAFGGHYEVDRLLGTTTRVDEGYHSYACAVTWQGNDAWVTFFFDDMELGTSKLFARHQDMTSRVDLFPIVNVAVRAASSWTKANWDADTRLGDMFIRDMAYFDRGYRLV